jgi:predicted N-acetyltransferase YhbS
MNGIVVQKSFDKDIGLSQQVFTLLETTFPGIRQRAQVIRELGAAWESVSTPFLYMQAEQAIAHVGVLELPLWIQGEPVTVGDLHAVCTHPQHRRRGYFRQCLTAALNYCDSRYESIILTTGQPALYEPFGFRVVQEHAFVAPCRSQQNIQGLRVLDLQLEDDRTILHRLLSQRAAVSDLLGVIREKAVFLFYEATNPLYYAEDLDLIAVMEIEDRQLKLYDIVWQHPCSLAAILDRISQPIDETVFYFSPDRVQIETQPFLHRLEGDSYLMVRGPWAIEGQAFMLPRPARC